MPGWRRGRGDGHRAFGLSTTDLLIIGAGPFGLAMARYAAVHGLDHIVVGRSMEFWKQHMPANMWLRSGPDWHLDPMGELTLPRFMRARGLSAEEMSPLTIERYLEYADWFRHESGTEVREGRVAGLSRAADRTFTARLSEGDSITARRVLLALGFHAFQHCPEELVARLPEGRWSHTRDFIHMDRARHRRCLIVGGRQSAFEWAALLAEAGAAAVHVVHRHATPEFTESDWSWVPGLLRRLEKRPSWFHSLKTVARQEIGRRFWTEGRLKLEPWLPQRMPEKIVRAWPETEVETCSEGDDGELTVRLSGGQELAVDELILATGYRVDTDRLAFLDPPILEALRTDHGCPDLDDDFQSVVPGLYFTRMLAARDFGPYMGFTVSVRFTTPHHRPRSRRRFSLMGRLPWAPGQHRAPLRGRCALGCAPNDVEIG